MPFSQSWLHEVRVLLDEQRGRCAWFWRADFAPRDAEEARRVLEAIARRGDRDAYVRAVQLLRQLP